jgi:glycerol-3-phosphate dehydrogenase
VRERLPFCDLHTVVGGKLTTHRSFAERAIARMFGFAEPSPTRTLPLPGGAGPREVLDPLWQRHGSDAGAVRRLAREVEHGLEPLCPHRPFLRVEAVHAVRELGAVTLGDLLLRRLVHTQGPCLQESCLRGAHEVLLRERRWPADQDRAAAIAALRAEVTHLCGAIAAGGAS